ncbi:phosphoadenosine phosphosulfate reductase domain-containing protein [Priestia aryabhattai]
MNKKAASPNFDFEQQQLMLFPETEETTLNKLSKLEERWKDRESTILDPNNKKDKELMDTLRIMKGMQSGEFFAQFEKLITFLTEQYLKDRKEWILTYSGGKDSSLVAILVFKMLQRLPKDKRAKKVHILSANTKVETRKMTMYLKKNLEYIKKFEEDLNLKVHLVEPDIKRSFFWNVIGRGTNAPTPKSPYQWCTGKMKIDPMNKKMNEILSDIPLDLSDVFVGTGSSKDEEIDNPYDVMMLVGSRLAESTKRANSIKKYSDENEDLFGYNPDYNNVKMCYPIKYIETEDLWNYVMSEIKLPWGLPTSELLEMYSDGSGECPMTKDELLKANGCGSSNSRNGCWVCLYAGRSDKMLETLISSGETEVRYLADFKAYLYDVTNDVRYREPLKRKEIIQNKKRILEKDDIEDNLFSLDPESEREHKFYKFERVDKTDYVPGGFTIELRIKLYQKLLYAEKMIGYPLIDEEEREAILRNWEEEGYIVTEKDLVPINHQYDGQVVLKKDGTLNTKETKNKQPVFLVKKEIALESSKLITFLKERQIKTNKSYFCFFNYNDLTDIKIAYNYLTFVVCDEGVNTEAEAYKAISKWLYFEDNNSLTAESAQILNKSLILKDLVNAKVAIDGIKETIKTDSFTSLGNARYVGNLDDSTAILKDIYRPKKLHSVNIENYSDTEIEEDENFYIIEAQGEVHLVKDEWGEPSSVSRM